MKKIKLKKNEILVLRTVSKDMTSTNGFKWPKKGSVECDDFIADYKCGHGLHGLPWNVGSAAYLDMNGLWLVVVVDTSKYYCHGKGDMADKCKFKSGKVVFCGEKDEAVKIVNGHAPLGSNCNWSNISSGNGSKISSGDGSNISSGDGSNILSGDWSNISSGDWSKISSGNGSNISSGNGSKISSGNGSKIKSKKNTVQIIDYWKDGKRYIKSRVITEQEADKWYKFENEEFVICTDEESKKLDEVMK